MVAQACNPSYSGDRGRKLTVRVQPRQKHETLSGKNTKGKRTGGMTQVGKMLAKYNNNQQQQKVETH
jgi:hypothetical protein